MTADLGHSAADLSALRAAARRADTAWAELADQTAAAAAAAGSQSTGPFRVESRRPGRSIAIEPVRPGTTRVHVWSHSATATTCLPLTPAGTRALAFHLLRSADAIDPPDTPTDRPIPYRLTGA